MNVGQEAAKAAPGMSQANASQMHFYSVGLVAANKLLDSKDIEVVPIEQTPYLSGELSDNVTELNAPVNTASGDNKEVNVKNTASIQATWLPLGQVSRKTAPDVRRGEKVQLLRFGDADKYYWIEMEESAKLRRLETVVFAFSNNSKENETDSADSTYYLEVSTHRKILHIHTSKSDKEPFAYDVQINAKDGKLIITDDANNTLYLDSQARKWNIRNTDGSYIDMDKSDMSFFAANSISFKTNSFSIESNSFSSKNSSYSVNSSSVGYQSSSYGINSGTYGVSASGGSSVSGGMNFNGGSLTHNGVNVSSTHTHTGVHGETSPPH